MSYREHEEKANQLARFLKSNLRGRRAEVSQELAQMERISPPTALTYLSDCTSGFLLIKISPLSRAYHELQLIRLSKLFGILNVPENHEIVSAVRGINPNFEYKRTQ